MNNYDPRFQDILMGRPPVASRLTIKEQERLDEEIREKIEAGERKRKVEEQKRAEAARLEMANLLQRQKAQYEVSKASRLGALDFFVIVLGVIGAEAPKAILQVLLFVVLCVVFAPILGIISLGVFLAYWKWMLLGIVGLLGVGILLAWLEMRE